MSFRIGIDPQPLYTISSKRRGIGFYNKQLFQKVFDLDRRHLFTFMGYDRETYYNGYENVETKSIHIGDAENGLNPHQKMMLQTGRISNWIRENKINVLHFTSPFDLIDIFSSNWYKEVRTIATIYDLIPAVFPDHYLANPIAKKYFQDRGNFLRKIDRLVVISESVRRDVTRYLQIPPSKIDVIHGGVDEEFTIISKNFEQEKNLKDKFGVNGDFLMSIGGVDKRKNMDLLIQAYSYLPMELKHKYQLLIVCKLTPDYEAQLKQVASLYGVSDRVIITDYVQKQDLILLYNYATLFIYPSIYEGFGMPVLEAMKCGVPVLSTSTSSIPEIIEGAGVYFNPNNITGVTNGIKLLLQDPSLRENLLGKGIEQAKKFTWERTARLLLSAYEKTFFRM